MTEHLCEGINQLSGADALACERIGSHAGADRREAGA